MVPCPRCNGKGGFAVYRHVRNGVCFRCEGACVVAVDCPETPEEAYLRVEREAIVADADDYTRAREAEAADRYAALDAGYHEASATTLGYHGAGPVWGVAV